MLYHRAKSLILWGDGLLATDNLRNSTNRLEHCNLLTNVDLPESLCDNEKDVAHIGK
jgi:hypothetical protein